MLNSLPLRSGHIRVLDFTPAHPEWALAAGPHCPVIIKLNDSFTRADVRIHMTETMRRHADPGLVFILPLALFSI